MFNLASILNLGSTDPVIGKAHVLINCSKEDLFKFIAEGLFENYPRWSPEVKELEKISPGPVKQGTEGRQVRIDQGRRSESKFIICSYEPSTRMVLIGNGDPFRCMYELQEIDGGQSIKLTFTFELLEILAIMRPFEALVRSTIKEGAEKTVQNIKRLVEQEIATKKPPDIST